MLRTAPETRSSRIRVKSSARLSKDLRINEEKLANIFLHLISLNGLFTGSVRLTQESRLHRKIYHHSEKNGLV